MNRLKVIRVNDDGITFENGSYLTSNHDSDCCESHQLNFQELTLSDFEGLKFDLTNEKFFNRVDGYGIELLPLHGHPVRIAGHGSNNGYYSTQLDLVVTHPDRTRKVYNITECQDIQG